MIRAISIVGHAFRLWWQEFMLLIFFNLVWLALQIPIVTGPPATAAMYVIARQLADGEFIGLRHGLDALVGNFWFYQSATGWLWTALRLLWGIIALGWFTVNLFYWPFWLAQEQRSPRITLRNSFLFLVKRPGFALTLMLISSVLIAVSVITTLPLATALMAWLSLIGVLAVEEALHPRDEDDHIAVEPIQ